MNSKTKLIASIILISISVLYDFGMSYIPFKIPFLSMVYLLGVYLGYKTIVSHSDFQRSIYMRICYLWISIYILGALFKLMHWPFAGDFLGFPLLGIVLTYTIRFVLKKIKKLPDFMKLAWVLSAFIGRFLFIKKIEFGEILSLISCLIFINLLFYYIYFDNQLIKNEKEVKDFLDKKI